MAIAVGSRWSSTVCPTEVLIVRPGADATALTCGGAAMVPAGTAGGVAKTSAPPGDGLLLGKRYVDETTGLQLLCTKPGTGTVAVDGRPVTPQTAKPLPASD
jgi:hypothetical protein